MNTKYIGLLIGVIIIGGGAFYSGVVYARTQPAQARSSGQFAGRGTRAGGLVVGNIIAKDASSITVKMLDGSTKIIILATSTPVMRTTSGSMSDLTVGTGVTVTGQANSDGSVTASSLLVRPAGFGARPNAQ